MGDHTNKHDLFQGLYGDLDEFADRVSSILGCPITIEDANHRLLAYSMHDDRTDKARISTIIGRRVPEKVINSLWKEGIIPALIKSSTPIKVPSINEVGLGNRAAISIRKNDEILGFIWALEVDHPFTDRDLEFLQLAAKEAKNQILQLQSKKNRRNQSYQEFLWQLLTGHYQSEKEIKEKMIGLSHSVPQSFSIVVFEFPNEMTAESERQISYMLTTTQKINVIFFTIDQNRLIVLAGTSDKTSLRTSLSSFIYLFISQMNTRFEVTNISGASGLVYENLLLAKQSYQEALHVLTIKRIFPEDTSDIYLFGDLGVYQFIDILYKQQNKELKTQQLEKLMAYDHKHQTELFQTLKTYLEKDSNPNEAAKALHIHVNTLTYRLKRISEVGGINLKAPLQKTALFIELKLIQYRNYLNG